MHHALYCDNAHEVYVYPGSTKVVYACCRRGDLIVYYRIANHYKFVLMQLFDCFQYDKVRHDRWLSTCWEIALAGMGNYWCTHSMFAVPYDEIEL